MEDPRTVQYYRDKRNVVVYRTDEVFVPCIPFYNFDMTGYYVSNYGRVYNSSGNIMCHQSINRNGYMRVHIHGRDVMVHRLVLQSFMPNPKCNELQVNHKDGNKSNNHLSNLEWCTREENMQHAVQHGLVKTGQNDHKARHTDEEVHRICQLLEQGYTKNRLICMKLGVNFTQEYNYFINNVRSKREWKRISSQYNF